MKRFLMTMMLAVLVCSVSVAQKKELDTARKNIKKGEKLVETEQSMRELLQDSVNQGNSKIWNMLFEALKAQNDQCNENLYLGKAADTTQVFKTTLHLFDTLETLDSLSSKYRKKHSEYLAQYRGNLMNGGIYYIHAQNYREALLYLEEYLKTTEEPMFEGYDFQTNDPLKPRAAYWAVYSGYKLGDAGKVVKYAETALGDTLRRMYVLQYLTEAYRQENDADNYRKTLERGFGEFKENGYFFTRLMLSYEQNGEFDRVLEASDALLEENPESEAALTAKSLALLNLNREDECLAIAEGLIETNPDNVFAWRNAALAAYNICLPLAQKSRLTKLEQKQLTADYQHALTYMEQYRELRPEDSDVWAVPLYEMYLFLNMGVEFEEIEKYIR